MTLHLFRDGESGVFASLHSGSDWRYLETLDPVKFAWGEENFGEVYSALAVAGFYMFEGEMQPLPSARSKPKRQAARVASLASRRLRG